MLKRLMYEKLLEWKNNKNKTALMLTGVRQCGKTYLVREFGKNEYDNLVEINFLDDRFIDLINDKHLTTEKIYLQLSLMNKNLSKGKTLVFFDEVQANQQIITLIKFLVEENKYDYILSGSLLGVELTNVKSFPVGYMHIYKMYPMNFKEFLLAQNIDKDIFAYLKKCYLSKTVVANNIHTAIMQYFYIYLIVGGMPKVVDTYIKTKNLNEVDNEQKQIENLYKLDISQYDVKNAKLSIINLYNQIPTQLGNKNLRFKISELGKNYRFSDLENKLLWIVDAGVAHAVYNVSDLSIPLLLNEKRNLFKLFKSDIGLLTNCFSNRVKSEILSNSNKTNMGSIYENVVALELISKGYKLNYYNSKKNGEIDFLIEHNGKLLPIEIKSGKNKKEHKSIDNVLGIKNYDIDEVFVLSNDNLEVDQKIIYLPIYMLMFLKEEKIEFSFNDKDVLKSED